MVVADDTLDILEWLMLRFISALSLLSVLPIFGCGGNTPPVTGPATPTAATTIYVAQRNVFADVATPDLTAHDLIVKVAADATGTVDDSYISGPAGVAMSAIAADPNGNLYISALDTNTNTGEVLVYSKNAKDGDSPLRIIRGNNTTLVVPFAIAADDKGNVYVLNMGGTFEIVEFKAGASGDAVPLRQLTNAAGTLSFGSSIAVNKKNEILLLDTSSSIPEIGVFSASQSGEVLPIRILTGPHTRLVAFNTAMTVDANDDLFVTSFGSVDGKTNALILQFAADASGDTAPVRTISGAKAGTNIGFPGIAVDGVGTIFVQKTFPDNGAQVVSYASSVTGIAPVRTAPLIPDFSRGARGLVVF